MNPNKALWEKGDFTRIAESMRENGEDLVRQAGITPGMRVLDLGCGDGTTAIPAAKLGARVLGVDIASNLVAAGNRRAQQEGLAERCRFLQGDACGLAGLENGSFDRVVSIFGAMFAPRPFDVARDPIAHDDPPAGASHADHLLRYVERARREHRAEDADDEIEARVLDAREVGRIALLEAEIIEIAGAGALIAGGNEIGGDVDAEDGGAARGGRHSRGSVAAAKVEDAHARLDAKSGDELLTAVAHGCGDAGEVAFLPQRLVGIGGDSEVGHWSFS